MPVLYNEIEPFAAQWLRNLSTAGHIAEGTVDERSIRELHPDDIRHATQFHTFAGIGVWSYALRLAGWPDDVPVWTGSCPCQPFSGAGKRGGFSDERHLWPDWFRLIGKCRPPVVFGEQVASPDGYRWLDLVQADMEGVGYAFGAAVLPAAGVGAPHIRHRIYWVGDSDVPGLQGRGAEDLRGEGRREEGRGAGGSGCAPRGMVDSSGSRWAREREEPAHVKSGQASQGPTNGFWSRADWIPCRDGYSRPVEPGTQPLAHGSANRVGCLRAYGNAIVAPVAATFIRAVMESFDARP